jgi:hypothetical protein
MFGQTYSAKVRSSKFCSDLVDIKNSAKDLQTPLKTNEKFI